MAESSKQWFVMRDLTRSNAKQPAYQLMDKLNIENFTPKVQKIVTKGGKRTCIITPFIHDLLFVHDTPQTLDPLVESIPTFQYRFLKGRVPMTVRDKDMERFIRAVSASPTPRYYRLEEITPDMRKRRIRIIGGPLDNMEGTLLTLRGSKVKRLLVELPMLLAAAVEVEPEYIQLIDNR